MGGIDIKGLKGGNSFIKIYYVNSILNANGFKYDCCLDSFIFIFHFCFK